MYLCTGLVYRSCVPSCVPVKKGDLYAVGACSVFSVQVQNIGQDNLLRYYQTTERIIGYMMLRWQTVISCEYKVKVINEA